MRAVLCSAFGGPDVLRLDDCPDPTPGPGEVAVEVAAAGINFADILMIAGKYQEKPDFPFSPGLEIAGRVRSLGPGVEGPKPGSRVMALVGYGGYAEAAVAQSGDVFEIPEEMDFVTAAGFPITYGTGHGGLVWKAALRSGETLLVHGAAGGVGLAAVEVGKALGARVIATAGGPDKLAVTEAHGADELIDYRSEDLRERVKALTDGRGVDVVFDPVGGDVFDSSLRCVAWGARMVIVGFAAGRVPQIPANHLLVKNTSAMGLYWGSYRRHAPDLVAAQFATLLQWYRDGLLRPHVSHALDLSRAAEALTLLSERRSTGKVVLTMTQD